MGSRQFARFCKFLLYLGVAISIYYLIAKCRDFDPDLKSKLVNVKDIQAKLSKFLAKWNVMTQRNEERGVSESQNGRAEETKDENRERAMNEIPNDSRVKIKEKSNGTFTHARLNTLNTFMAMLETRQKVKDKQRDVQFDKLLTNLTNVLQFLSRQTEKYNVNQETVRLHSHNPSTSPKTTDYPHSTKHTSFEEKTTSKSVEETARTSSTKRPTISTSSNQQSPTSTRKYTMQAILERQAGVFLDKMKTAGIQYKSTNVFFPKQQEKRSSGIFYREVLPPGAKAPVTTVFLLHGEKYDSRLWLSIGTLYVLGASGFRVIAVDLPGYGGSKNTPELPTSVGRCRLLAAMMLTLSPEGRRVLVSPGKSGVYSVPLVMTVPSILKGVVFVAPNFTSKYPTSRYEKMSLATLVIFGAKDETTLHVSSLDDLEHLPNRKIYSLPNAKHDCYLDQTETFHRLLKRFLVNGNETKKKVLRHN